MMKMVLKVFALPVLLLTKFVWLLCKLVEKFSSYVFSLFLLVLAVCAVVCVVQSLWSSLAILAVMGLLAFAALVVMVWLCVKVEIFHEFLGDFIHS